jgi:hypothetical protein
MEAAMADTTSQTKTSTEVQDWSWAVTNDPDVIAIALFFTVGLLASIYLSIHFPMSDQVAAFLSQAS